jgi:hypothetical protein
MVAAAVSNSDEASAMAAMFKAQTANWEETQEKMTQLVSRLRGFLISCSIPMSHERNFLSCFALPIPVGSAGLEQCCAHLQ